MTKPFVDFFGGFCYNEIKKERKRNKRMKSSTVEGKFFNGWGTSNEIYFSENWIIAFKNLNSFKSLISYAVLTFKIKCII